MNTASAWDEPCRPRRPAAPPGKGSGSLIEVYRLTGAYAGRILKGKKPSELSTKVEMFLNLKVARALDITVPLPLLGRADEVIE